MFLAIEEIRKNKLKYSLIFSVLLLISYLVFFLSGLANGLMESNKSAIDKWKANAIVLSSESNKLLSASKIDKIDYEKLGKDNVALLGQRSLNVWSATESNDKDKIQISLLGVEKQRFLIPNIIEGRNIENNNEIIVDISLKEKGSFKLGETINISGSSEQLKVVGFTDDALLSVAPVAYIELKDYQKINSDFNPLFKDSISALVVKGDEIIDQKNLEYITINDFIKKLPGYNAQNLTFGFMIGFLVIIAAVVIGIFIFVLTSQKTQIFGLMKIQGLSNFYISKSVLYQTLIISFLGTLAGLILTYLSSLILPVAVPFKNNYIFYLVISMGMVLFALVGAIFSIRIIFKVDPLKSLN